MASGTARPNSFISLGHVMAYHGMIDYFVDTVFNYPTWRNVTA